MLHIFPFFASFEYWANPSNPLECYITWMVDVQKSTRLGAAAAGPDQGANGTHVGQRLIPEELMSIVLNLGISRKCFLFLLRC
jgi:beta-glucan synthesis-associated protein KRE6